MNFARQCRHIHLSHNSVGDVTFCADCGVVSLSLQCMTIRLEAEAFAELISLLNDSRAHLQDLVAAHAEELPVAAPVERHMH